ncbi:hypothetical protein FOZ61_000036 [Perkinsus olseni]|uniref:Myb-like domain-containing protein n=1 Tax=Perkinsus olseni TaxID=32597 RepID=A0A7J6MKA5_PEROL|nr:hypothetical protein FOZ61_000036 [Perkinsus olseni]KAF4676348.1 hypothetical protein FOL46_004949 [Perkinsus olseni]
MTTSSTEMPDPHSIAARIGRQTHELLQLLVSAMFEARVLSSSEGSTFRELHDMYYELERYAKTIEGKNSSIVRSQPLLVLSDPLHAALDAATWRGTEGTKRHALSYRMFVEDFLSPQFISPSLELDTFEINSDWQLAWTPAADRLLAVALHTFGHHARSSAEISKVHFARLVHSPATIQSKLRVELLGGESTSAPIKKWQQDQTSPWKLQEDIALQLGVAKYGSYNTLAWHQILTSTDMLGRRDPVSCCYRWFGVLLPKYSGKRQNALLRYKSYLLGELTIGQPRGPQAAPKRKRSEIGSLADAAAFDSDCELAALSTDT